ncbi:uncharacterized protein CBL_12363 [Carabus blaptoides fortunei]
MDKKEIADIIYAAENYVQRLNKLDTNIKQAEKQIVVSGNESLNNINAVFSSLKQSVIDLLDSRKAELEQNILKVQNEGIKPLQECQKVISGKIVQTSDLIAEGNKFLDNSISKDKQKDFYMKSNSLGSLPAVPSLMEVPFIHFTYSDNAHHDIMDMCNHFGSLFFNSPVQINSLTEKPGAILVEWEENEVVDDRLNGLQEFRLQFAFGDTLNNPHLLVNFHDCYIGPNTEYLKKDLKLNELYSFRVCCKMEGSIEWSPWSVAQVTRTTIHPFCWDEKQTHFTLHDGNRLAIKCSSEPGVLLSMGAQLKPDYSIEFSILEMADQDYPWIDGVGLCDEADMHLLNIENYSNMNSFVLLFSGKLFVDGNEKSTKLPCLQKGSKISFNCEEVNDKIRVYVETGEKNVTYDWKLNGSGNMMSSKKRTSGSSNADSRKELHSSSRSAIPSSSKLRMDSRPQQPRITDPSLPAGRRREIDTVMKKARSSPNSNGYWDKKLLEVEAKDPNRWRHSGYKAMYIGGSSSPSPPPRHSRRSRSRSRSYGRRSPPPTVRAPRSVRPRSPPHRPPPRRSPSASSVSSCSDDSCSVCSPKNRTRDRRIRSRSRSYSVPRSRANKTATARSKPVVPSSSGGSKSRGARPRQAPVSPPSPSPPPANRRLAKGNKPSDPRRAPVASSRVRAAQHEVIELSPSPRSAPPVDVSARARDKAAIAANSRSIAKNKKERKEKEKVLLTRIKTERKKRRRSPAPAESSGSEDSSSSTPSAVVASTRLTLSERFGKMAQWSVDRRDIENMRITKNSNSGDLKVMIEAEDRMYESPPLRYSHSPAPIGHYPDELLASGPTGLAAWDDVRVRYQYYKDLGYLRDLSLDDYIKWEQWWYKYQEWLKNERYYEHWLTSQNRRRRKRLPATQRLN